MLQEPTTRALFGHGGDPVDIPPPRPKKGTFVRSGLWDKYIGMVSQFVPHYVIMSSSTEAAARKRRRTLLKSIANHEREEEVNQLAIKAIQHETIQSEVSQRDIASSSGKLHENVYCHGSDDSDVDMAGIQIHQTAVPASTNQSKISENTPTASIAGFENPLLGDDSEGDTPGMTSDSEQGNDSHDEDCVEVSGQPLDDHCGDSASTDVKPSLDKKLIDWAVKRRIPLNAVDELLAILRGEGHSELPKSAVTLLGTPRNTSADVKILGSGKYWYHGIWNCLKVHLTAHNAQTTVKSKTVVMDIFIDGISPYKRPSSNSVHLWPIAGRIISKDKTVKTKPFIIALWCGKSKEPDSLDEFLNPFVEEYNRLMNGFELDGVTYKLKIRFCIADAPARAWLRRVNPHNSLVCCERCDIRCVFLFHRMTFPLNVSCSARTDESFRLRLDEAYHRDEASPLEGIMGMVSQFPLEPLHLIDLGVMKRILKMLVDRKGASKVCMKPSTLAKIDALIEPLSSFMPSEFDPPPKGLKQWSTLKGKELRRFLYYDGVLTMFLLEGLLPEQHKGVYECFLKFSCGVRILGDECLCGPYNEDANSLLQEFVEDSARLFGGHFVVYNVHHLAHLAEECKLHGHLEEFNAYLYESSLGNMKRHLRRPGRALEQIVARTLEEEKNCCAVSVVPTNKGRFSEPYPLGPSNGLSGEVFARLEKDYVFRVSCVKDRCCLTKHDDVVVLESFVVNDENAYFVGRCFEVKTSFFDKPLDSTLLDIYKVGILGSLQHWLLSDIVKKCVLLPIDPAESVSLDTDEWLAIPFLH